MADYRDRVPSKDFDQNRDMDEEEPGYPLLAAGKRTLTSRIPVIHREASGGEIGPDARERLEKALGSGGQPLPSELKARLETALGADLSAVRVHEGQESAAAAKAVSATAFTVGQDIHFGAGKYDPASTGGQRLIAHEVAHTRQQAQAPMAEPAGLEVSQPGDSSELAADRFAGAFIAGDTERTTHGPPVSTAPASLSRAVLQRELDEESKKTWDKEKGDALVTDLQVEAMKWANFAKAPSAIGEMPGVLVPALVGKILALYGKDPTFRAHFISKLANEAKWLNQMASINNAECTGLVGAGLAKARPPAHRWTMKVTAGGDPLKGALQVSQVTVQYSNSFGWAWTRGLEGNIFSISIGIGAEASDPRASGKPKVGVKPKGGLIPAPDKITINGLAEATNPAYWGPANLPGKVAITKGPSGEAKVGGSGGSFSAGALIELFGTDAENAPLEFKDFEGDVSAEYAKSPGDLKKKPSLSINFASIGGGKLGIDGKGTHYSTPEPEPTLVPGTKNWFTIIRGFETGEDKIPADQLTTSLGRMKGLIAQHRELIDSVKDVLKEKFGIVQEYRLRVRAEGYASRRWQAARDDAERRQKNMELSTRRAQEVTAACYAILGPEHEYEFAGKGAALELFDSMVAPEAGNEQRIEDRNEALVQEELAHARARAKALGEPEPDEEEIRKSVERRYGKSVDQPGARIVHVTLNWVGWTIKWVEGTHSPAGRFVPDPNPDDGPDGGGGHEGAPGQGGTGGDSGKDPGDREGGGYGGI